MYGVYDPRLGVRKGPLLWGMALSVQSQ